MARNPRRCFNGKDLKTIKNARVALQRLREMDARNTRYNNTHNGLQKVMFFNGPLTTKAHAIDQRCESATMQVYAVPTPE